MSFSPLARLFARATPRNVRSWGASRPRSPEFPCIFVESENPAILEHIWVESVQTVNAVTGPRMLYSHSHSPSVDPFGDFVPFHRSSHLTDLSISSLHNSTVSSAPILF